MDLFINTLLRSTRDGEVQWNHVATDSDGAPGFVLTTKSGSVSLYPTWLTIRDAANEVVLVVPATRSPNVVDLYEVVRSAVMDSAGVIEAILRDLTRL